MTFQVRIENRPNSFNLDERVWILGDGQGSSVEIAPSLGFNAYRWHVPAGELLYADPKFFQEKKPTRSGFPVLFPFPNRIRDGRFTWEGKEYHLPTNDSSGKNAIHGFVCQRSWRVVDQGADGQSAWVTGEFWGSQDAPETLTLWPADYRIALTYRLAKNRLGVEAAVSNPGNKDLPFGLGYHPYFALSLFGDQDAEVKLRADKCWELVDCLPTGKLAPVDVGRHLSAGRNYRQLQLDDVFTGIEPNEKVQVGSVSHGERRLDMHVSDHFREIVAFTPPHRQAICLEPYTCVTDAVNLQPRGINAGWRVLKSGMVERSTVRLVYRNQDLAGNHDSSFSVRVALRER